MHARTLAMLMALLIPADLWAEGFRMNDGRYADGKVTELELSQAQILTVRTKRVVVLTEVQRKTLGKEAGVAPSVLSVYSLKVAGKDCTCLDYNLSIWFEPKRIEVPHRFLVSDAKAEEKAEALDSAE